MLRKNHKYNFRKLYNQIEKNSNNIDLLEKKNILTPRAHTIKRYRNSILLDRIEGQEGGNEGFHSVKEFFNMPEWAIPLTNVILECETESGIPISGFDDSANPNQLFNFQLRYHWQAVLNYDITGAVNPSSEPLEDHYILYIDSSASFKEKELRPLGYTFVDRPFYLNLYLVFINDQTFHENQNKKT